MNPEDTQTADLARAAELRAARRRYHHPNLALLAAELGAVEAQLDAVLDHTATGRQRLARAFRAQPHHPLKGWCLAVRLLEESEKATPRNPDRGAQLAELARQMAAILPPERYGASHLAELAALAWALEGNALRAMGRLKESAARCAQVEPLLAAANAHEPGLRARTLAFLGSYQLAQRRLAEAQATVATALALAHQVEDGTLQGAIYLQQAAVACELGQLPAALAACREAVALLPVESQPRWCAQAHYNLANYLARAGSFHEAEAELAKARPLLDFVTTNEKVKVFWLEGAIYRGLGQGQLAISHLRKARLGFVRQKRSYQVALVALELAMVLLEQGHVGAASVRALEAYKVFKNLSIRREALAAFVVMRDAVERNALTLELLQQAREQAEG